jgi:valyl-tRNA synthetase
MGHVFSYSQADFVARFQRMNGKDVFYPMGFDDNGLPTERLVEKIIEKKAGVYEAENGRGSFVTKCREIVNEAEKEFEVLFNSIALSVDWEQKYQTISPESQKISQASFLDLHAKGLVEKKFEPVFWDISDRTALAQADLVDKEVQGVMNEIEFTIEGSDEKIVIMTTRPELLPACVAVMVHPEDARYKKFHGLNAITPLFDVKVKIIPDDLVQLDKGTGAVMCCTFGDETDIRWWKKHNLPLQVILQKDGKIDGIPIKQFKEKIIEDLRAKNLLLKQENITRAVKCAERSGVPIEILVVPQWFIKILDKKELLKVKANECNWFPDYMRIRIEQWIDGLSWDWCISRQRFFGVAFPVWYSKRVGEEGKILVAEVGQLPCDPSVDLPRGYSRDEVSAETDIMDTWATSSISPQLSSRGISEEICFDKARHEKLFPADLRPQAHEIIRTWAFYTLAKSVLHQDSIPWKNLMISGWCLAADKTKMSKSKGNVVTPTSLIEEKGSDIVRYWASTSHLGADTAYSEDVFKIGQKLTTKLFNAAKFASMNFEILDQNLNIKNITQAADLWILARLQQTIKTATKEFEKFEYARAREAIEEFFWRDFCDNYLEICKVRSYGINAEKLAGIELSDRQKTEILAKQQSAILTLAICLNNLLKLLAPILPHICDEIYATIFAEEFAQTKSINARGNWPKVDETLLDQKFLDSGEVLLAAISEVRKFKSENNLSMKTQVQKVRVANKINLSEFREDLANVCNAAEIELVDDAEKFVEVVL